MTISESSSPESSVVETSAPAALRLRNRWGLRQWGFVVVVVLMVSYMIILPGIRAVLNTCFAAATPQISQIDDPSVAELIRIRSAKLAVFCIFVYVGAAIGSFINVAAYGLPRGQAIMLRSSACPVCQQPIARLDNLPLFSYLNLAGRCRNCSTPIPVRYFLIELVAASLFALLFLTELVTGAGNIPGTNQYLHTGIVWIILYTKWDVIGLTCFHAGMLILLLLLTLVAWQGERLRRIQAVVIVAVVLLLVSVFPQLRPVAVDAQIAWSLPAGASVQAKQAFATVAGVVAGVVVASVTGLFAKSTHSCQPHYLGWLVIGISLGWQATLSIAVLALVALLVRQAISIRWTHAMRVPPTAITLAVTSAHHPFWKWLAERW